jgi:hypothetical protein
LEAEVTPPTLPLVVQTYSDSPLTEAEQIAEALRKNNWPEGVGPYPRSRIKSGRFSILRWHRDFDLFT